MSDPTNDTFRQMLLEARIGDVVEARAEIAEIGEKVDRSETRWTEDEMRETVANVLADALRDAGRSDREALIRAIAPNILSTVRGEISSAHPEIIEALSPRMGELIRAAVVKATEGLQRQIDDAVPVDLWIAALKSRLTGTSGASWIIREEDGFRVIEAFLIERGSGLVLAQDRPIGTDISDPAALDDDLLGGMIAALDAFARDAFGGGGIDELRQLTLSAGTIYLRASPTKILALRCTGIAPPKIEDEIDHLLDHVISRLQEGGEDALPARLLAVDVAPLSEENGPSGAAIVGKVAAAFAAILLAIWGHFALEGANSERWTETIFDIAHDRPAMTGYPVDAVHADGIITLTGLVPDEATRDAITADLARRPLPINTILAMPVAGRRLVP